MWIMSQDGFVSAVYKGGKLQLRARDRESLVRMGFKGRRVKTNSGTDYPFRVYTTHEEFTALVVKQIADIDYSNFKDQAKKTRGDKFARALSNVWTDMLALEPRDVMRYIGSKKKGSWRYPKTSASTLFGTAYKHDSAWWDDYLKALDERDADRTDRDNPLLDKHWGLDDDVLSDSQQNLLADLPSSMHDWTEEQWTEWLEQHPEGV